MAEVLITLYVKTESINEKNIDANCNFGQSKEVRNEDYTVLANVKDTIIWQGVSLDNPKEDVVIISEIIYDGDYDIFGKEGLKGNEKGQYVGVVDNDTKGEMEIYTIVFSVMNGKNLRGVYPIDPKLQVNP